MQETSKYLPKTASALASLQESIAQLEELAQVSIDDKQQLQEKLTTIRQELQKKASQIENIINNLNGALK